MTDVERLREWVANLPTRWFCNKCGYFGEGDDAGPEHNIPLPMEPSMDRCGYHAGRYRDRTADALLAAWEAIPAPIVFEDGYVGCDDCVGLIEPGKHEVLRDAFQRIEHAAECPYGRALAALRNLIGPFVSPG